MKYCKNVDMHHPKWLVILKQHCLLQTTTNSPRQYIIGERERANLVVRTARIFYIYLRPYVVRLCMLQDCALLFIRKDFKIFTCLPVIMSCIYECAYMCLYGVCVTLSQSWIIPEKMPFVVVKERRKERARETPEQREARLYQHRLRDRERGYYTRCLAVISMRNLASERTLVYSLAFAALFDTWQRLYTSFKSLWF